MPETQLKEICEESYNRLKKVCMELEKFLNTTTLNALVQTSSDPEQYEPYYRDYLSDFRHLLVNCENAYEKLGICLRRARFNKEFAEEALYTVYHTCVNMFFYPKGEVYEEDGRNSYTGRDAIIFHKEVTPSLKVLTLGLSKVFEYLRDELQYYETDYVTMKRMSAAR
ncbi:DUF3907 family protein [Aneurinibacillus aneurinilyticus]|jgi:hypothetical protein|uniref:DUF3907 family protein n=2 Tax=Aneurinibacillus aneurinilyticus TaxID=1391 RepID=A0A848CWK3_ANEAE|nr:DUF3907 family protein [Aneurinibacillus aneurinilyticus]ERI10485.1 hypothetical protein HMPREF0083_01391 [Aneurinibacillus aneurinilyticus ATCC 12856]MCI1693764.1 YpuI family protein [Aneurinibacillus aneurinilyticus]MED0669519.1 DUF3907 family protein [Aneurinibacillus aneurinilyticus]MED0709087.1 DUF3907 family protein [Aneurinibacillus aneurinilyticus]MED0725481.1 DUF3907 family protein [Aneurinibacillus aneurinilyticus]